MSQRVGAHSGSNSIRHAVDIGGSSGSPGTYRTNQTGTLPGGEQRNLSSHNVHQSRVPSIDNGSFAGTGEQLKHDKSTVSMQSVMG